MQLSSIGRGLCCMQPAPEKVEIQILKYGFLLNSHCFHTPEKSEIKLNHYKSGTVCTSNGATFLVSQLHVVLLKESVSCLG
jgi:hypothetical protein